MKQLTRQITGLLIAGVVIGAASALAQDSGGGADRREPVRRLESPADTTQTRRDSMRTVTRPRPQPAPRPVIHRRHSMDVRIEAARRDSSFTPVIAMLRLHQLDAARELLESIRDTASDLTLRKVAAFDRIEIDFYAGDFVTARESYKGFARSHRRGYLANDALARIFLIDDNGDLMQVPLRQFARAAQWERVGAVDSAMAVCRATLESFPTCDLRDDLNLRLGDLSLRSPAPGAALGFYRAVADSIPETTLGAAALMRIGHYYASVEHDIPAAIETYEAVLERYPDSLETPEARNILIGLRRQT